MSSEILSSLMPGLAAEGPAPELGAAAALFVPLLGDWHIRSTLTSPDDPPQHFEGFWSFRWGLGGRAIYDVIGFRPVGSPAEMPYKSGMTVRFYDLALATWRQVWVGVSRGTILEFVVRGEGERIVIDGGPTLTTRTRWSFERIEPHAFAWEGRVSYDGGASWYLEQTIDGER